MEFEFERKKVTKENIMELISREITDILISLGDQFVFVRLMVR